MKLPNHMSFALIAVLIAIPASAQPGPGAGQGKGPGFRFSQDNTPGWSLMTAAERTEHREKMLALKTYDECTAYLEQHHRLMQERAKEKGRSLPETKANACERMKARGMFK